MNNFNDLSIIVKTFFRPDMLERFLQSTSDYQKKYSIKFAEVLIGDDSDDETIRENASVVHNFPDINTNYQTYEFNIGSGDGRNRLLKEVKTPYFLYCDDDFILDNRCDIDSAINILEKDDLDILGGWLEDEYKLETGKYSERAFIAKFMEADDTLMMDVNEFYIPNFAYTDCMMNFFIAKTDSVKTFGWDSEMKTQEHYLFFYQAFKHNLKMAVCRDLFAKHTQHNANKTYDKYRENINKDEFVSKMAIKTGFDKLIISYFKKNGAVRWSINGKEKTSEVERFYKKNSRKSHTFFSFKSIRRWLIRIRWRKDQKIIRLFGIYIINK